MADNVLTTIDEQIKKNNVVLFMKGTPSFPQCGFSAHTIEILKSYGYPFETVDVLADPAVREGIKQYSNWPTIPQVYIKGKFVGGCDIVHELHEQGELSSMLKAAFEK
ncbi:MAG: Grx4 family monothiol glutaredoxin [Candidatus Binatia bacterium]